MILLPMFPGIHTTKWWIFSLYFTTALQTWWWLFLVFLYTYLKNTYFHCLVAYGNCASWLLFKILVYGLCHLCMQTLKATLVSPLYTFHWSQEVSNTLNCEFTPVLFVSKPGVQLPILYPSQGAKKSAPMVCFFSLQFVYFVQNGNDIF